MAHSKITSTSVIESYRRLALIYWWVFGWPLEQGRKQLGHAVHAMRPQSLLELGAGTGMTFRHYPRSTSIVAVDICPSMIEIARARIRRLRLENVSVSLVDAESLPFDSNSFDCVTLPYVVSVTPDPRKLLHEAQRVCKINGTVVIANHFSGDRGWRVLEKIALLAPNIVGFNPSLTLEDLHHPNLRFVSSKKVNAFGLSRLIVFSKIEN